MKRVLIVEDETIMRESLRDWLKDEGYEVDTAESGEEALQKIGKIEFGVTVLDLRLPGKNGLEVLREATAQNPKFKGVIITAYPSVETAVEAMKIGAVSYIVKPFAPDALENAIEEVLGPVQAEVKPRKGKVEETIAITEERIPAHLEQGQTYFKAGLYKEALREFQSILQIAPGHIETRTWVRRAKEELSKPTVEAPEVEVAAEEAVKVNECLWAKMGVVSYRICTKNYECLTCEFDQMMQEKIATGEASEFDEVLERLKELPGSQRVCHYALKGDVSYRLCTRLFQCETCEFGQSMQDAIEQKMAKLAIRREALRKGKQALKARSGKTLTT